jgi:hypothetical protein
MSNPWLSNVLFNLKKKIAGLKGFSQVYPSLKALPMKKETCFRAR